MFLSDLLPLSYLIFLFVVEIFSLHFILIIFHFDYPRRNTTSVLQDIKGCIEDLESEQQMAPIKVQLIDSNVAAVYQASKLVEVRITANDQMFNVN